MFGLIQNFSFNVFGRVFDVFHESFELKCLKTVRLLRFCYMYIIYKYYSVCDFGMLVDVF